MAAPANALRVVIADDHQLFRKGLKGLLQDAGMEVVGEAADGADAAALVRQLHPEVAVLDLNLPGASGLQALRRIARNDPDTQTVVLTVSTDVDDVVEALAAGARGYLLKDTHAEHLAEAIRQAAAGQVVLSGNVASALIARVRTEGEVSPFRGGEPPFRGGDGAMDARDADAQADGAAAALTPREREVLRLIAEGADNVAIGRALSISPHTVKQYVTNIFTKLGVRSRVQAAVYAVRAGLV